MFSEIVEKKFPLPHAPKIGLFMVVKADQESSHDIEFSQVGKGIERSDSPDHPTHAEQARNVSKHRELIQIDSDALVTEQLSDVKKISRATAKIENTFRAGNIEFDLANAADVD